MCKKRLHGIGPHPELRTERSDRLFKRIHRSPDPELCGKFVRHIIIYAPLASSGRRKIRAMDRNGRGQKAEPRILLEEVDDIFHESAGRQEALKTLILPGPSDGERNSLLHLLIMDLQDQVILRKDILHTDKERCDIPAAVAGDPVFDPVIRLERAECFPDARKPPLIRDRHIKIRPGRHICGVSSTASCKIFIIHVTDKCCA